MEEFVNALFEEIQDFSSEIEAFISKKNIAAGQRARRKSMKLALDLRKFRIQSIAFSKQIKEQKKAARV